MSPNKDVNNLKKETNHIISDTDLSSLNKTSSQLVYLHYWTI